MTYLCNNYILVYHSLLLIEIESTIHLPPQESDRHLEKIKNLKVNITDLQKEVQSKVYSACHNGGSLLS